MNTFYHVAPHNYEDGDNLYSFDRLDEMGIAPEYKWEDYIDTEVVCMFRTEAEAKAFVSDWLPTGRILTINLPDWFVEENMIIVREGFPAIMTEVPAEYIS